MTINDPHSEGERTRCEVLNNVKDIEDCREWLFCLSFIQWAPIEMQGCYNCIVYENDSLKHGFKKKKVTRKEIQNWSIVAFANVIYLKQNIVIYYKNEKK